MCTRPCGSQPPLLQAAWNTSAWRPEGADPGETRSHELYLFRCPTSVCGGLLGCGLWANMAQEAEIVSGLQQHGGQTQGELQVQVPRPAQLCHDPGKVNEVVCKALATVPPTSWGYWGVLVR